MHCDMYPVRSFTCMQREAVDNVRKRGMEGARKREHFLQHLKRRSERGNSLLAVRPQVAAALSNQCGAYDASVSVSARERGSVEVCHL